ncbi:MAG: hypothetical protein AB7P17_11225 [Nitrospirales bacterium]
MRFNPALVISLLMMSSAPGWAQENPTFMTAQSETAPAQSDAPAPQDEASGEDQIHSRGLEVFGCPLSLDAGAMTRCFQRVLDRETDKIRNHMQREFDRNPYLAKLEHERKILQAATQLPLQPLMTCLKNASSQAQTDLGIQVQRWLANPGAYSKDAVEHVLAQARSDLSAIFREEMQARQNSRAPVSAAQAWDRSVEMLNRLSQRNPAVRCLMQPLLPHLSQMKQVMVQNQSALSSQFRQVFDPSTVAVAHQMQAQSVGRVILTVSGGRPRPPAAAGTTGTPVPSFRPTAPAMAIQPSLIKPRGIMEKPEGDMPAETDEVTSRGTIPLGGGYKLTTPEPPPPPPLADVVPDKDALAQMVKGMAAERLLDAGFLQNLSTKVNRVVQVATDGQASQQAIEDLRQFITQAQVMPPDLRFDFGWEVLRFAGHQRLDQKSDSGLMGGFLLKDLFGVGVMAQCGIFPLVGGITCAPTVLFADLFATATIFDLEASWAVDEHKDLDRVMTEAKGPIRSGKKPEDLQIGPGPMRTMLRELPNKEEVIAFADSLLQNLYGPLFAYHQQVLVLAEAAVRR